MRQEINEQEEVRELDRAIPGWLQMAKEEIRKLRVAKTTRERLQEVSRRVSESWNPGRAHVVRGNSGKKNRQQTDSEAVRRAYGVNRWNLDGEWQEWIPRGLNGEKKEMERRISEKIKWWVYAPPGVSREGSGRRWRKDMATKVERRDDFQA